MEKQTQEIRRRKIAFVSVRYGVDINGGAEQHCRMLAERLTDGYDVEVLTTCVKDYVKKTNEYAAGREVINGVLVRRFNADPYDAVQESYWTRRAKPARRLRMFLYRIGLLTPLTLFVRHWNWRLKDDIESQRHTVFYSKDLLDFMAEHKEGYDVFIVFSSNFPLFYFSAMEVGDKMLAIPTLHFMRVSFRTSLAQAFRHIRYVGFNTASEQRLAKRIFGAGMGESSILSVGIEVPEPACWEDTRRQYSLPGRYILFIGRVDRDKTGKMLSYYAYYRKKYGKEALPLVVMGHVYEKAPVSDGIMYIGFVSDEQKRVILQHTVLLLNPSLYESLSLVLLEALYDRIPALVNGRCNVFREHQRKSHGAVQCYMWKYDFVSKLHRMTTDTALRIRIQENGKRYVEDNYNWQLIMSRLHGIIDIVSGNSY